jgi:hypothetical protein
VLVPRISATIRGRESEAKFVVRIADSTNQLVG